MSQTADEFLRQLENDPEYQRRKAANNAKVAAQLAASRAAQRLILEDLRAAGIVVESVWDFVNTSEPYPTALPILLEHLTRGGYPDRVMEGLGRAIAVKPMVRYWDQLVDLYLHARSPGERDGLAVAIAACATKAKFDELLALASNDSLDRTRVYFLQPLKRLDREQGRAFVESRVHDPVIGREASRLTEQARRRRRNPG